MPLHSRDLGFFHVSKTLATCYRNSFGIADSAFVSTLSRAARTRSLKAARPFPDTHSCAWPSRSSGTPSGASRSSELSRSWGKRWSVARRGSRWSVARHGIPKLWTVRYRFSSFPDGTSRSAFSADFCRLGHARRDLQNA